MMNDGSEILMEISSIIRLRKGITNVLGMVRIMLKNETLNLAVKH
jgi:hypothetical protein